MTLTDIIIVNKVINKSSLNPNLMVGLEGEECFFFFCPIKLYIFKYHNLICQQKSMLSLPFISLKLISIHACYKKIPLVTGQVEKAKHHKGMIFISSLGYD